MSRGGIKATVMLCYIILVLNGNFTLHTSFVVACGRKGIGLKKGNTVGRCDMTKILQL